MKYMNFVTKLVSLAVLMVFLFHYQSVATDRAAVREEHEAMAAEIESYNNEILAAAQEAEETGWQDGTYEGSGIGFGGDIVVSVTIADQKIASIEVLSAKDEDEAYFAQASEVLETIENKQTADVDTVSGATFSSTGLIEAVKNALAQAEG